MVPQITFLRKNYWLHLSVDYVAFAWVLFMTLVAMLTIHFIGTDGLVNHGDTGFPLHPIQRLIDALWAWQPRQNFGASQYLAHSNVPIDVLRAIPELIGLSIKHQTQLFFVITLVVLGVGAERFATVGLGLRHPLVRIVTASVIVFNPFQINQLLGGQGVQILQYGALLLALTSALQILNSGNDRHYIWFAFATMFIGTVFLPLLFLILICLSLFNWKKLRVIPWLLVATIGSNLFWIVPLVSRTFITDVLNDIFQSGSDVLVLEATRGFTGLDWVLRSAYGHYPVSSSYSIFLHSILGMIVGFASITVVAYMIARGRGRYIKEITGFIIVLFVGTILATGVHYKFFAPLYNWVFEHIEFFRAYRVPAKFLLVSAIGQAAILGVGLEYWLKQYHYLQRRLAIAGIVVLMTLIMVNGGLFHIRSIARLINLARYHDDYFQKDLSQGTRWLEVLPASLYGSYIPTQDTGYDLIKTYVPPVTSFDRALYNARTRGQAIEFLSNFGIGGLLEHRDIPNSDTLGIVKEQFNYAGSALSFYPFASAPSRASILIDPIWTDSSLLGSSFLSQRPDLMYIQSDANTSRGSKVVNRVISLNSGKEVPLQFRSTQKGTFKLALQPLVSSPLSLVVRVGEVGYQLHRQGDLYISEPLKLDEQSLIEILYTEPLPTVSLFPQNPVFESLIFAPQGVIKQDARTTTSPSLNCTKTPTGARTEIRGFMPGVTYKVSFTNPIKQGAQPHLNFEWLNPINKLEKLTSVDRTASYIIAQSEQASLYVYCESERNGVIKYENISIMPISRVEVSDAYILPSSYPEISQNEQALVVQEVNRVTYTATEVPEGVLVFRYRDDPWWQAFNDRGQKLEKVGRLLDIFPAWNPNGSKSVTIRYMGQNYFVSGIIGTIVSWVLIFALLFYRKNKSKLR